MAAESNVNFDAIVIGGGINGAGIARDAARRGLRVALIEQGDFCNATSRWCSRLIHGGLRYLEFAEFGLVRESLRERATLLRAAPHLVRPLPLLIPIYRHSPRGRFMVGAGLSLYDLLSADDALPAHRMLDAAAAHALLPGLEIRELRAAALYQDAQVEFPERLVVENLLDARSAGASLHAYTRAEEILTADGRVSGVRVRELETGVVRTLRAPLVVNATGPWVDELLGRLPGEQAAPSRLIGGSRGAHIVVDRLPGLAGTACYAQARADGRPFFILPWNGLTLIGTTDIPFDGDPAEVRASPGEIAYLLEEARRLFPAVTLTPASVHYSYAGVRPLPRIAATDQAAITRRHHIRHHRERARGLYSVIGGKLTTYRHLAEQVADRLARRIGRPTRRCTTESPLPGALTDPVPLRAELVARHGIPAATASRLVRVYGQRAITVAALCDRDPGLTAALGADGLAAEVVHAFESEAATTLADVLMRRTMLGLSADLGMPLLDAAVQTGRQHLGWSERRAREETDRHRAEVAALRVPVETSTEYKTPGAR